jgi:membrane protease YdiL (CAAX protease family)
MARELFQNHEISKDWLTFASPNRQDRKTSNFSIGGFARTDAGFKRSHSNMSDPTEFVITATFMAAMGIFAVTAAVRRLRGIQISPAAVPVEALSSDDGSPYQTPGSPAFPPELPHGRVPVWLYQPLDLLGIGFIFVLFFGLVMASVRASAEAELVLDVNGMVASIAFQFISAGIVTFFVIPRIRPVEWLGLRWPAWRWVFLIAPCGVFSMWMFFGALQASGFMEWMESLGVEAVQDSVKLLQTSTDPAIIGLMVFAAVVAAPLCEEIVFRGYFYPAAKKFVGPWAAGICSALVFAAAHGSLAALLPLFVFGCVLVFIYEKTGSLWAPVAVHFCFNGATVLIQMIARHYHLPLDAPL